MLCMPPPVWDPADHPSLPSCPRHQRLPFCEHEADCRTEYPRLVGLWGGLGHTESTHPLLAARCLPSPLCALSFPCNAICRLPGQPTILGASAVPLASSTEALAVTLMPPADTGGRREWRLQ